jgi:hypothetical protein
MRHFLRGAGLAAVFVLTISVAATTVARALISIARRALAGPARRRRARARAVSISSIAATAQKEHLTAGGPHA